jgi:hypothetical protein
MDMNDASERERLVQGLRRQEKSYLLQGNQGAAGQFKATADMLESDAQTIAAQSAELDRVRKILKDHGL